MKLSAASKAFKLIEQLEELENTRNSFERAFDSGSQTLLEASGTSVRAEVNLTNAQAKAAINAILAEIDLAIGVVKEALESLGVQVYESVEGADS